MSDFFEPAGRGVQHAAIRAANRRAVLTTITFNPGISNADVSRRTGLAPQTASAIVTELEEEGLISRGDVLRGRRGQPATPLFLDYAGAYAIGCEISWRHVDVVLINIGSQQIAHYSRDYAFPDATSIVTEVADAITGLVARLTPEQQSRLVGMGLASPTRLALHMQAIGGTAEQAQLWSALDLRAELERATGLSTTWFNDGNSACFAQMVTSAPPRPANLVHLFVSTFLGAGITAEHTLWEGPTGNSANLGIMMVCGPDGKRELGYRMASTMALGRLLEEAGKQLPTTNPADWPWQDWQPQVDTWIQWAGSAMADIIFNTGAVLEVGTVIIDSVVPPEIVERLVSATHAAILELPLRGEPPPITAGTLGRRAAGLGAAQLLLFRRHFSRELDDMLAAEEG